MKNLSIALAAMALLAVSGSAQASTYMLDYTSNGAAPLTANLLVTTADTLNSVGGYDVTDISGDVSGDTITGLIANPNQPGWSYSADGWFMIDNVFTPGDRPVSYWGLLFQSATHEYNLFSDSATSYELYQATPNIGFTQNSVGTIFSSVALPHPHGPGDEANAGAVPEPASWMTMLFGFGLIGGMLRRRRPITA